MSTKKISFQTSLQILAVVLVVIFLLIVGKAYQNQSFSFHFVDEEENFVIAKYMLGGEMLYSDLFSNHQPLTYLFSAAVQKASDPNSVFLLIKRHREAMIIWSSIWALVIVFRFGLWLIPVVILYEISKIYLLGNLFLAESLSAYPLSYLVLMVLYQKIKITRIEMALVGILFGLVFFLLSPLWPLLALIIVLVFRLQRGSVLPNLAIFFTGVFIVTVIVFKFASINDFIYYPIYTNLIYFIPIASQDPFYLSIIKSFLTPILSFVMQSPYQPMPWIIGMISLILIFNLIILLKKGQYYLPIVIIMLLGLANIRFVQPGLQYYQGFHLLPWYMILLLTAIFTTKKLWRESLRVYFKAPILFGWLIVFIIAINFSLKDLFVKKDIDGEFFINYSRQFSIGEAVRIMKDDNDALFVAPDEWLVYWQADIKHVHPLLGYYAWMDRVPYLNRDIHEMFRSGPPMFFYANDRITLKEYFGKYREVKKDGTGTALFVLPEKINRLSGEQKDKLIFHNFSID